MREVGGGGGGGKRQVVVGIRVGGRSSLGVEVRLSWVGQPAGSHRVLLGWKWWWVAVRASSFS